MIYLWKMATEYALAYPTSAFVIDIIVDAAFILVGVAFITCDILRKEDENGRKNG